MTPDKNIQIGDVVQRKEGGPWMTVDRIEGQNAVCLWHDETGLRRESVSLAELVFPEFGAGEDLT